MIWRDPPAEALAAGHGGSDYFEVMDFVDAVHGRKPPTIDIHAAMDMTLPGLVSQVSIRQGGKWLAVPIRGLGDLALSLAPPKGGDIIEECA